MCATIQGPSMKLKKSYQFCLKHSEKGLLFSGKQSNSFHSLTHQTPKLPSHRNQSIDLQSKSIDWFLYDGNFGV